MSSRKAPSEPGEFTNIKRLLDILAREGRKDAGDLAARSGISRAVIVSTLHQAANRGQVTAIPKSTVVDPADRVSRHSNRGRIYEFVSYSPRSPTVAEDYVDPWDPEVRETLERIFMPSTRAGVAWFDTVCQKRLVCKDEP